MTVTNLTQLGKTLRAIADQLGEEVPKLNVLVLQLVMLSLSKHAARAFEMAPFAKLRVTK